MADEDLGIIMVKLESLISQVSELVREVRTDYVRKDLYASNREGTKQLIGSLQDEVDELETKVDAREKDRLAFQRQIAAGVIVGLILLVASTATSVVLLLGGLK